MDAVIVFKETDVGLTIGGLTWNFCKKISDGSAVTTTNATLTEIGLGWYTLHNPDVTENTLFSIYVTGDSTDVCEGIFDVDAVETTKNSRVAREFSRSDLISSYSNAYGDMDLYAYLYSNEVLVDPQPTGTFKLWSINPETGSINQIYTLGFSGQGLVSTYYDEILPGELLAISYDGDDIFRPPTNLDYVLIKSEFYYHFHVKFFLHPHFATTDSKYYISKTGELIAVDGGLVSNADRNGSIVSSRINSWTTVENDRILRLAAVRIPYSNLINCSGWDLSQASPLTFSYSETIPLGTSITFEGAAFDGQGNLSGISLFTYQSNGSGWTLDGSTMNPEGSFIKDIYIETDTDPLPAGTLTITINNSNIGQGGVIKINLPRVAAGIYMYVTPLADGNTIESVNGDTYGSGVINPRRASGGFAIGS